MDRWRLIPHDRLLHLASIILAILGLVSVFTTTFFPDKEPSSDFWQQVVAVILGLALCTAISNLPATWWRNPRLLAALWGVTMLALILVLLLPSSGPKRWIGFGSFTLQVSEFAKLTVILVSSLLLTRVKPLTLKLGKYRLALAQWVLVIITMSPVILLVWRQPSLGSAILTTMILGLMILTNLRKFWLALSLVSVFVFGLNVELNFLSGHVISDTVWRAALVALVVVILVVLQRQNLRSNIILLGAAAVLGTGAGFVTDLAWHNLVSDYQKDRVEAFLNPDTDPLGTQWQVNQAKTAIGSAGLLGKGFLQGTQVNSGLLSYDYTDFAYSAFVEQFGLLGGGLLLVLILFITHRVLNLANQFEESSYSLIAVGIAAMFLINTMLHVAMNLGLMPVTGVPLPLVSYGGSAVLANFIGLGILQSIASLENKRYGAQRLGIQPQFRYNPHS